MTDEFVKDSLEYRRVYVIGESQSAFVLAQFGDGQLNRSVAATGKGSFCSNAQRELIVSTRFSDSILITVCGENRVNTWPAARKPM